MSTDPQQIPLPSVPEREDAIYKPAKNGKHSAVFIFVHGLADSAHFIQDVADQFQAANKLPHMAWVLPNARYHRETMDTAWFLIHGALPVIKPTRPEHLPDEDEEGMLETRTYLESIVEAVHASGVPLDRIVLGGFSQGCAMSLLLHLTSSKYSGKLAGVAGLLGWAPLCDGKDRLEELRKEGGLGARVESKTLVFLGRGTKDPLVPRRAWRYTQEKVKELCAEGTEVECREYEGLEHTLNGAVLRDMCVWLEKVVPPVEGE
ncbi:Acyl-protein thioesterase 1 [Fulvia fulva]|uniref:Acyl-protein thioesterase 1 n=1 Tax=Passalora fulva TaxID=5499 RepID=A0A9Q8PCS6_PASFU|nr:Acyl-protein thioesterase 1 [Fulvia fulva]KAK4619593.1 Acyl-protein thioesterase 1 [Fulvia fulva]KAK4620634.1 Acyl-protein thioesterase 1 [Fulvia fulva]UJO20174.1 Acyl-protein thioesterase 1 [Fulvia fulva]WPV17377.1 Acyl-protein thioesterase 1 [Fulvia fulva]WPV32204.1 Acyl-protein thioesterase 1 [Fulvia fulva]